MEVTVQCTLLKFVIFSPVPKFNRFKNILLFEFCGKRANKIRYFAINSIERNYLSAEKAGRLSFHGYQAKGKETENL